MPERPTFYDWRDGVDVDAEMADWSQYSRRARVVVTVGFAIAIAWLIVFTITGTSDGVGYMAGAAFFLAMFWIGLAWFGKRRT